MFLEKLQIQGFKSFANKNILEFPGIINKNKRGITAIVGPNGSGKSNIADAVRWVLGEQSMKSLRGKKSEDVIFSGSTKKGQLSMAEVSIFLNNEEPGKGGVGKKVLIDYPEVILTRRLFRSGDSEYLINNSRVRLVDMQILLSKAKFGQKTYSVIGQGVVEGFLNTSLAERKEFFDEATGVKQFQIKRDSSLNKLCSSYENFNQTNMLLSEIEPRLKSLTRQIGKLKKRDEIEPELKDLQLKYYGKSWHEINNKFKDFTEKFLEIEKIKREKEKKLEYFNNELNKIENQEKSSDDFEKYQREVLELQERKNDIVKQLARMSAQTEIKFDLQGRFDLSWLFSKKEELENQVKNIKEEIKTLEISINYEKSKFSKLEKEKYNIDKKINLINEKLLSSTVYIENNSSDRINVCLKEILDNLAELDKCDDINKIKKLINNIKNDISRFLEISEQNVKEKKSSSGLEQESVRNKLLIITKDKENIIIKINDSNLRISARAERVKLLNKELGKIKAEIEAIEQKLKKHQEFKKNNNLNKETQNLNNALDEVNKNINIVNEKVNSLSKIEEKKRSDLFSLQKKLQLLQNEINEINLELSDLKINSTRYETKLEDLEIEIRHNFGSLKDIKLYKFNLEDKEHDEQNKLEKIMYLRRQLDLIGGIDPETEKEYKETKERFDYLSGQVNDLSKAIKSLEEIIRELDLTIKDKFDKEFKIISSKFEEYFKILFNGGIAKIIKIIENEDNKKDLEVNINDTNENDLKNNIITRSNIDIKKIKFLQKHNATGLAGIEIQATPPGKKIKSISMLSGGERALTAIALICAIISANPSPFVVLDEVDAALDEANSERLAKILDDLSYKTQFIVITHNRASMRRANILYGITMEDNGVSKLLSVNLEGMQTK